MYLLIEVHAGTGGKQTAPDGRGRHRITTHRRSFPESFYIRQKQNNDSRLNCQEDSSLASARKE